MKILSTKSRNSMFLAIILLVGGGEGFVIIPKFPITQNGHSLYSPFFFLAKKVTDLTVTIMSCSVSFLFLLLDFDTLKRGGGLKKFNIANIEYIVNCLFSPLFRFKAP